MKSQNLNIFLKRVIIAAVAIYVVYTFFVQQKQLNAYKADANRYNEQIAIEKERKAELNKTKENINSEQYIEEIAREKLDMYLPNEKVYIDISK